MDIQMSPRLLGILNVTPDSFSDGGRFVEPEVAIKHATEMVADGADLIDIGGESTRPGAAPVSTAEELRRVLPIVEAVSELAPVSIDTRRAEVARAAVAAGASVINDISATLWPEAAELGVGWIAMHMQGEPTSMQDEPFYDDVVEDVVRFLDERATKATEAGVSNLWIDPGFGFGKTVRHNVSLLANLDRLVATGWPVAVGTSRKSMLGHLLAASDGVEGVIPPDDRLVGSVVSATYAMSCGVGLIRAHDVKAARQAVTVFAGETYSRRT